MKTETKDKLELRHLAPYLPCGLKVYDFEEEYTSEMGASIYSKHMTPIMKIIKFDGIIKPILRPLSDLAKTQLHKGKIFIPIIELYKMRYVSVPEETPEVRTAKITKEFIELKIKGCLHTHWRLNLDVKNMPYFMIKKLHEWHFDTEGLIEKNLAIDINTIK